MELEVRAEEWGWWDRAKAYVEVTKPRSVFLLVFTALPPMVLAAQRYPFTWSQAVLALWAVTLACAGANAVSCYVDRDLDKAMERTCRRPVPSGRIYPAEKALCWGLALFLASLLLGWRLNPAAALCLAGGMLGYVGIYSLWLKRRSVWNIVLGGVAGGLPALFGWMAVSGKIAWLPVLMAALVVLWIPNHIWSLAIFYREDYARVQVPMLPVVTSLGKALHCLLLTVILMVATSLFIGYLGHFGWVYWAIALLTGAAVLALSLYVIWRPNPRSAWLLFKFSSPYLFLLFLAMLLDVL
ncbi:heme o synthase [Desulfothermobacter acidiphilus]|uniref:heme o synthase n=1 Tax=Desulfothermobacter acidiphilus TaxID=1938353 RepID=UPI003F8911FB